jgi:hypothetical protein
VTHTAPPTGVYLDTNVLRYFWEAASDPRPPCARGATNQAHCMQVAALRVVLYAPAGLGAVGLGGGTAGAASPRPAAWG